MVWMRALQPLGIVSHLDSRKHAACGRKTKDDNAPPHSHNMQDLFACPGHELCTGHAGWRAPIFRFLPSRALGSPKYGRASDLTPHCAKLNSDDHSKGSRSLHILPNQMEPANSRLEAPSGESKEKTSRIPAGILCSASIWRCGNVCPKDAGDRRGCTARSLSHSGERRKLCGRLLKPTWELILTGDPLLDIIYKDGHC